MMQFVNDFYSSKSLANQLIVDQIFFNNVKPYILVYVLGNNVEMSNQHLFSLVSCVYGIKGPVKNMYGLL